ncbi:Ras-related protein Rab-7L1 [Blattella germanica]|nr:Ras-related protein Rab-7L1 [Blattella germanica]
MNNLHGFPITEEKLFKVLIVGDPTVGKTSFVQRFVQNTYKKDYKGTVGVDFALKVVKSSDNQIVKLQLWDIAGQERFTWMTRIYYKDSNGCVIMFDSGNKNSLMNTIKWKKDVDSKCTLPDGTPLPCILLANKCDLAEKQVTKEELDKFYKEHNFIAWTETSAKEGIMVNESMKFLMELMLRQNGNSNLEPISDSIKLAGPAPPTRKCC